MCRYVRYEATKNNGSCTPEKLKYENTVLTFNGTLIRISIININ